MIKNTALLIIVSLIIPQVLSSQTYLDEERIEKGKRSIVRVLIDGKPSGTGFFINGRADIATCWHVISPAISVGDDGVLSINRIEIELNDKSRFEVRINRYYLGRGYQDAALYDYCLLQPVSRIKADFDYYSLGDFQTSTEGSPIYTAGFPLGIEQLFFSTGIISAKWNDHRTIETLEINRMSAWLDCTLNKGNSGGPIIKLGESPAEDKVIGIATFILTPGYNFLEELEREVLRKPITLRIGELDQMYVNRLFGDVLMSNSVGISGCISIEYFKKTVE